MAHKCLVSPSPVYLGVTTVPHSSQQRTLPSVHPQTSNMDRKDKDSPSPAPDAPLPEQSHAPNHLTPESLQARINELMRNPEEAGRLAAEHAAKKGIDLQAVLAKWGIKGMFMDLSVLPPTDPPVGGQSTADSATQEAISSPKADVPMADATRPSPATQFERQHQEEPPYQPQQEDDTRRPPPDEEAQPSAT